LVIGYRLLEDHESGHTTRPEARFRDAAEDRSVGRIVVHVRELPFKTMTRPRRVDSASYLRRRRERDTAAVRREFARRGCMRHAEESRMIVGIGVDLVDLARIASVWNAHGERFLTRILTDAERRALALRPPANRLAFLAGRYAAKEAGMKALGHGFGRVRFTDIEIASGSGAVPTVAPSLAFHGEAARLAAALGVVRAHVSLSHGEAQAIAYAVLER
jgi:holo-[acyl-carrier protein] synthase